MTEPTIKSNTVYKCKGCGARYDFEDPESMRPCVHCGGVDFVGVAVAFVCDFCSEPLNRDEAWAHPCEPFEYGIYIPGAPEGAASDDWAACQTCHELVEAGDQKALTRRNVDREMARSPEARRHEHFAYAIANKIHQGFFQHRTGPGYKKGGKRK